MNLRIPKEQTRNDYSNYNDEEEADIIIEPDDETK